MDQALAKFGFRHDQPTRDQKECETHKLFEKVKVGETFSHAELSAKCYGKLEKDNESE